VYFSEETDGPVRLSTLDAARLADLDAGAKLRWVGGDHLRSMGQKLGTFGGIRKILGWHIKPFLLRRIKDNVATESPPKTEMMRSATLTGAQRDLYEKVQLVMDKKVREEVAEKRSDV